MHASALLAEHVFALLLVFEVEGVSGRLGWAISCASGQKLSI
jgi:hypothetical protein